MCNRAENSIQKKINPRFEFSLDSLNELTTKFFWSWLEIRHFIFTLEYASSKMPFQSGNCIWSICAYGFKTRLSYAHSLGCSLIYSGNPVLLRSWCKRMKLKVQLLPPETQCLQDELLLHYKDSYVSVSIATNIIIGILRNLHFCAS